MKLEALRIDARPIRAWQAMDLGLRLGAVHWGRLCLLWLLIMMPWVLLVACLPIGWAWKSLLVWWMKPMPEQALLFVLSRAVFGEMPSIRESLASFPRLARPQFLQALTWRRFSPTRSMDMPVQQLEGLSGSRRQSRLAVLHGEQGTAAGWLTIIGIHVESFLSTSLMILMVWLIPPQLLGLDALMGLWSVQPLWFCLSVPAMAAVAPFYVAGGFMLYLNRRIQLEGWDIELVFRRLAERRSPRAGAGLAAVVLLLGTLGTGLPQTSWAAQERTPEAARETVQTIIDSDEVTDQETIWLPEFLLEPDEPDPAEPPSFDFELLALILELLGWGLLIVLVVWLVYRYAHLIPALKGLPLPERRRRTKDDASPETLFGLDVREASLPEDVVSEVRGLWHAGQTRAALALLYRGTLSRLLSLYAVEFKRGDTEGDCQRRVTYLQQQDLDQYFRSLTTVWLQLAYAHRPPHPEQVEQLCEQWPALFESRQEHADE
ncbi:DUF4129 domain-containing protein [Halomonadaceae bacterium KBTZ08]